MKQCQIPASYAAAIQEASVPLKPNFSPGPEYGDDQRRFQGIPGITCSPGGRLWAVWYAGGQGESPLNYMMLFTSADRGETWKGPLVVLDAPGNVRACDGNIWVDPQGRLWFFWMQTHTLHDGRWGVWAITADNADEAAPKWSEPRRLSDGVMLNKPTVCSNGKWLFPVSMIDGHVLGNEKRMLPAFLRTHLRAMMSAEELEEVEQRAGAWVYALDDEGQKLKPIGCARVPADCATHNEHMIVERSDSSLWMLIRARYGIGTSTSTDGGVTWSPVVESGIPHTSSRFFFCRLRSGNILLVKNGPMETIDSDGQAVKFTRTNLTAFLSEDDGKTWSNGLLLEERGCTYPDGTEGADGTLYVIYDHGRRHEREILMARFTEEDIKAGCLVSASSRLKILINKATAIIPDEEDWNHFKGKDDPADPLIFTGI